jgi:vacuolar-type H+-ATPase subunit E/Vma4
MSFLVDKAFDQASEYLSDRTEPANMPAVTRLLNEAMDKYEDGELSTAAAESLVKKLLPLVKPEARGEIESMFNNNLALISRYLNN